MADRYVEKTHQGYFSRIGNSIMGVLIGFLMLPGSVLLISWNEYRTIHRTKGLIEAEKVVEEVADPLEILPSHENKLVHVVAKLRPKKSWSIQNSRSSVSRCVWLAKLKCISGSSTKNRKLAIRSAVVARLSPPIRTTNVGKVTASKAIAFMRRTDTRIRHCDITPINSPQPRPH